MGTSYEVKKYYRYDKEEGLQIFEHLRSQGMPTYKDFDQDIAIIITKLEIKFSENVYPIKFPDDSEYNKSKLKTLNAAGWGIYDLKHSAASLILKLSY